MTKKLSLLVTLASLSISSALASKGNVKTEKYDNSKDVFVDHIHFNSDPRVIPANSPTSEGTKKVTNDQLKRQRPFKGVSTFKYNFDNGLFTIWQFQKGAFVPVHDHDTDQITYMLKGEIRIVQGSDYKEFIFKAGDTFVLPAFTFHYLEALKDSEMVGVNPATTTGKSSEFRH